MDSIDIMVRISTAQAAQTVEDEILRGSLSAKLVDRYAVSDGGKSLVVMVFEKYYMRNSSRASLTVTIDDLGGVTRVHAVGSGGGQGAIFGFDWGAASSFASYVSDALEKYR